MMVDQRSNSPSLRLMRTCVIQNMEIDMSGFRECVCIQGAATVRPCGPTLILKLRGEHKTQKCTKLRRRWERRRHSTGSPQIFRLRPAPGQPTTGCRKRSQWSRLSFSGGNNLRRQQMPTQVRPVVDHCMFRCSGDDAINVSGAAVPTVRDCEFIGRKCGLKVRTLEAASRPCCAVHARDSATQHDSRRRILSESWERVTSPKGF
jgi:hypothetical protein